MKILVSTCFIVLLSAAAAVAAPETAATQPVATLPALARPISADYEVYVGGVHLLDATAYVNLDTKKYHMFARAQTIGIWGDWFPWETTVESEGKTAVDTVQPTVHKTVSAWKHKPKTMLLRFDDKGAVAIAPESTDAPDPKDRLADDVTHKSVDPLSGVLQLMAHFTTHEDCDSATAVFDGKRRFDLETKDKGIVQLRETEVSVFSGAAHKCELRFRLIAGQAKDIEQRTFWKTDKGKDNRPPFTIWMGRLRPDLPPMPVMAETSSPFGYVMIYLKAWRLDDRPRPTLTASLSKPLEPAETKR
ncbi:MAG: DUF3108 domain-containing protein [Alphaproteobacteria bacterium]|nr:DUF3108 domain-containing protein [Alphaproteobacteria bacterium]